MNCGKLLFDNGDGIIAGVYRDTCIECKYLIKSKQSNAS